VRPKASGAGLVCHPYFSLRFRSLSACEIWIVVIRFCH